MKFFLKILVTSLAVLITAYLMHVKLDGYLNAIIVALVLSLLNTFVKPVLIYLTIPATVLTFGLFLLAINAFMIMLTSRLIDGFDIGGFWRALQFSIILSLVTWFLEWINNQTETKKES